MNRPARGTQVWSNLKIGMNLTIQIPDELARELAAIGGDLARRALEGFALEEFKSGRLTKAALRLLLDFSTSDQLERFLSAHGVVQGVSDDLSIKQYDNLSDLLLNSPFAGASLDLGRSKDHPRSVDFG